MTLVKSIMHNIGVVIVGLGVGLIGRGVDRLAGFHDFRSLAATLIGCALLLIGFLLRAWAAFHFYKNGMRVISLSPQRALITSGPYRFSRNPLYLGGNVFIFLGGALVFGSPAAVVITFVHLPLLDLFIRREEKQLDSDFGEQWRQYCGRTRRWL
jgi:protein-S-isoprenylcysteine O-methyltransferase Ste14